MKALCAALAVVGLLTCGHVRSEPAGSVDKSIIAVLRVVEDPDGHTNLRSGPSTKNDVVGKVASGAVVNIAESKGDWVQLETATTTEKKRYIHSSRLKSIDKWKQVSGKESKDKKSALAKHEGTEVQVQAAPFVASGHKVGKDKEGGIKVDGRSIWGTDGEIPRQSLSISVSIGGKPVELPVEATQDLYEPNMDTLVIIVPPQAGGNTLILMQNSDGAGAYCVVWSITNGSYTGRVVFGMN